MRHLERSRVGTSDEGGSSISIESVSAWLVVRGYAVRDRLTGPFAGAAAGDAQQGDRTVHRDRGDVPGWVMITVMTAALVVAILVPFKSAIVAAITKAMSDVTNS